MGNHKTLPKPSTSLQQDDVAPVSGPIFGENDLNSPEILPVFPNQQADDNTYTEIKKLLTRQVVGIPPARGNPGDLFTLKALGPRGVTIANQLQSAGQTVFHVLGDSGASESQKYQNEKSVTDHLVDECLSAKPAFCPAFLYHLGDLVYNFGEENLWFSQFYEPFEHYPAPIFAIPGNHDSFVVPGTAKGSEPLTTFQRNFCAASFGVTKEAGALHRTAMIQPGVYFTLDVPFVRIIGLFSNALEGPGVISSEKGKWPLEDIQLGYLAKQLGSLAASNYKGAVIVAVHHPPFSYSPPTSKGHEGCSPQMLEQIDSACVAAKFYPHAIISGHAHNAQRFTRTIGFSGQEYEVPFIISGCGGHNINPIVQGSKTHPAVPPKPKSSVKYLDSSAVLPVKDLVYEYGEWTSYGYLRVTANAQTLQIDLMTVGEGSASPTVGDSVIVDLASHSI